MDVNEEVREGKYRRKYNSTSDLFIELASEDAKRKNLNWVIRDLTPGAVRTISVKIETPDRSLVEVEIDPLARVSDVKEGLQVALDMPASAMCLLWNERVMEDKKPVHFDEIMEGFAIQLVKKKEVSFAVSIPGGELVHLKVCRTNTVHEVIKAITQKKEINEKKNLHLYQGCSMLCGQKLLRDYKIGEGPEEGALRLASGSKPMAIVLRSLTGWNMRLDVDADEWVVDVKKKIDDLRGDMPIDEQILIFNEITLHDDQPLSRYNIQNQDQVCIRLQLRGGGPLVHIVTSTGQYIPFLVYKFDSVQYVTQRVTEQFGIPIGEQQVLIYRDPVFLGEVVTKFDPFKLMPACCIM